MIESAEVHEARRRLGVQLAALRDAAGLRQQDLAPLVGYVRSTVGNVETGNQRVPRQFWVRCDEIFKTGGVLTEHHDHIEALARQAAENGARKLDLVVTGARPPQPAAATTDVDPALALHWTGMLWLLSTSHNLFGPRQVHDAACREAAVIRRYRHEAIGDVRTRLLSVEARWAEFASWTADNVGDSAAATHWLDLALGLARKAGDAPLAAYVLMRQAQQAADRLDGPRAAALAETASASAALTDRDRALCAIRQAQGHALRGDRDACATALKTAHRLVARATDRLDIDEDPDTIGRHCSLAYVRAHEGYCLMRLGRADDASRVLAAVLDCWPADYRQDEALTRAWLALSYAMETRLAEAGAEASRALTLATATSSARAMRTLGQLDARLATTSATAEIATFRTAFSIANSARRM